MSSVYDNTLRRLYGTRAGKMLWKGFSSLVNKRHVKLLVSKALTEPVGIKNVSSDSFVVPRIDISCSQDEKCLLLVVPFYGSDASSVYVDSVCQDFKESGYQIHAVIYSDGYWRPKSEIWDKVYYLSAQTGDLGQLKRDGNGNVVPDGNGVDDWAGDELVQFTASLSQLNSYRFCIVSYIFLSRIFDVMPRNTYRILVTHDIFTNRNSRIFDACGSQKGFYFSVQGEEEKKGLGRADLVLAIQEYDNKYFKNKLGMTNVETLPYIPAKNYIARKARGAELKIGYIGSGHRPNIDAIMQFISSLKVCEGFEFRVAGVICNHLKDYKLPSFVRLAGYVDNLEDFYASCDVIINPDMLQSGLKIKCVEALSFGLPLVCTAAASLGLSPESKYHTASSIKECADLVEELILFTDKINALEESSRELYERFYEKYHNKNRINNYEAMADLRIYRNHL